MEPKPTVKLTSFHLAGIIPVAGHKHDFGFQWDNVMMPIAENYTALERSVMECAYAGCETIWIVCNEDVQPLIRHRLGEMVQDPVWYGRTLSLNPKEQRKPIPIYYVPVHPKDRDRIDCYAWSILHGANTAYWISRQMSVWVTPDKYYVSFPYGVFPVEEIREHRTKISSNTNFYISYDNMTVQDNSYLSFTFGVPEFIKYRKNIREKGTGMYTTEIVNEQGIPRSKLPIEERYSARFFDLSDVFTENDLQLASVFQPSSYWNVGSWQDYRLFMGSSKSSEIKRPWKGIMRYREFNPIGLDPKE